MTTIVGVDPGKATGWAYGHYTDTDPLTLRLAFITPTLRESYDHWLYFGADYYDELVVERFVNRVNAFVPNLDGVKVEGLIEATYEDQYGSIFWQPRTAKGKAGEMDKVLKRIGMWQTGKMVGHKDGRDANDAIIHILKHMITAKHVPTLEAYFPDLL